MSAIKILLICITLAVAACGQPSNKTTSTSKTNQPITNQISYQGELFIPGSDNLGGATCINYNNICYKIGNNSDPAATQYINGAKTTYPNGGTFRVKFSGTFTQGTGYFPNPMAQMDIVQLTQLSGY